nr:M20/M25/M40 family metallo-hydrolase [Hyphomonas sp. Mor2]
MAQLKLALVAAIALGLSACAKEAGYQPEHFEAEPAIAMLQALSADEMKGRKVGTPENAKARAMIVDRFEALGLAPVGDSYELPFTYGAFADPETGADSQPEKSGINVAGRLEGTTGSDLTMIITAHYDHVGEIDGEIYNGADDNASGVVGLLAAAEYFSQRLPQHDVIFLAFDAEEDRLGGSIAFVASPPISLDQVALNLNFDMLSRGDNGILWASGTSHWPDMKPYVATVASAAPVQIEMGFDEGSTRDDWTLLSDHAAFFRAGIPHVYFGVEDHEDYHRPSDDFDKIDQDWFLRSIDSVVMMATAFDARLDEIYAMRQAASD